jgi:DNA-binding response OmpR family regulator
VVVAFDDDETMVLYRERHPDLVVVELVRPGRNGLELCRELGSAGATVMAVSALAVGADAIAAGAEAFLLKPLDSLQVLSTVKDLLGQSALVGGREPAR